MPAHAPTARPRLGFAALALLFVVLVGGLTALPAASQTMIVAPWSDSPDAGTTVQGGVAEQSGQVAPAEPVELYTTPT